MRFTGSFVKTSNEDKDPSDPAYQRDKSKCGEFCCKLKNDCVHGAFVNGVYMKDASFVRFTINVTWHHPSTGACVYFYEGTTDCKPTTILDDLKDFHTADSGTKNTVEIQDKTKYCLFGGNKMLPGWAGYTADGIVQTDALSDPMLPQNVANPNS